MLIGKKRITYFMFLCYGLVLLLIFHLESLSIGPLKVSHIWKSALLIFLLIKVFNRSRVKLYIYKPLFALALLQIFCMEIINNTQNAVFIFAITLLLPVFGVYVMRFNSEQLKKGLFFVCSFYILAFLPYQLGLLESIKGGYDLENYGVDIKGIIGPFQNVHGASIALATAFLINVYFWFEKTFNRKLISVYLVLAFYFLVTTYVRTGLAMVIAGLVPMFLYYGSQSNLMRVRLIAVLVILTVLASVFVLSNQAMMDRFTGKGQRHTEDSIENLGSGRGLIYATHLKIYLEANIFEQALGMGQTELRDRTALVTGSRSLSHNGFIQTLLSNGLIGLFFLLLYFKKIYQLKSKVNKKYFVLIKSLLFAFFIMSFVQNFDVFYFHSGLMVAMAFAIKSSEKDREHAFFS